MIKQAINAAILARSGKGSRVVYRLAVPAESADDQVSVETPELTATAAEHANTSWEAPTTQISEPAEEYPVQEAHEVTTELQSEAPAKAAKKMCIRDSLC